MGIAVAQETPDANDNNDKPSGAVQEPTEGLVPVEPEAGVTKGILIAKGEDNQSVDLIVEADIAMHFLVPEELAQSVDEIELQSRVLVTWMQFPGEPAEVTAITPLDDKPDPVNQPPLLSEGHVTPEEGTEDEPFEFRVLYRDADGDVPEHVTLEIDGDDFPMTPETWFIVDDGTDAVEPEVDPTDGTLVEENKESPEPDITIEPQPEIPVPLDFREGVWYMVHIGHLEPGPHEYNFITSDGQDESETEVKKGPMVKEVVDPEEPEALTGLVVEKGENWIDFIPDSEGHVIRLTPSWRDDGHDKDMLEQIANLYTPNRVSVSVRKDDIHELKVLLPEQKEGIIEGFVIDKDEKWIDIEIGHTDELFRLVPQWVGGTTGGLDPEILKLIESTPIDAFVKVTWSYDERYRLIALEILEKPVDPEEPEAGVTKGILIAKGEDNQSVDLIVEADIAMHFLVPEELAQSVDEIELQSRVLVTWMQFPGEPAEVTAITPLDDKPDPVNQPPLLSEGHVTPEEGTEDEPFEFRVLYRDADGDVPEHVTLEIDGERIEMDSELNENQGWDFKEGVNFSTRLKRLGAGIHHFRFIASDGRHKVYTDTRKGPMVSEGPAPENTKPILKEIFVTPQDGDTDSSFTFSVIYKDKDGDEPLYVDLRLDNHRFSMDSFEKENPEAGIQFKVTLQGLSADEHQYSFVTSDGIELVDTGWKTGPNVVEAEHIGTLSVWAINSFTAQGGTILVTGEAIEKEFAVDLINEEDGFLRLIELDTGSYQIQLELENGAVDSKEVRIVSNKVTEIELKPVLDKEVDSDEDHLFDDWEIEHFGNLEKDSTGDEDEDGLENLAEFKAGTNPQLADTDEDQLPDGWEVKNQTNPIKPDAYEDRDEDNLNNLAEYKNGTHPTRDDTDKDGLKDGDELTAHHTDPTKRDSDGDLMPDGWELKFELNPLSKDGDVDLDNDNLDNIGEFRANTDPHSKDTDGDIFPDGYEVENGSNAADAGSTPAILTMDAPEEEEEVEPGQEPQQRKKHVKIRLRTIPGLRYQIKASGNMKTWANHGDPIIGKGEALDLLNELQDDPRKFYKVEISDE